MLQPLLELDQRTFISDLRAFLATNGHCINFVDGTIGLIP